MDSPSRTSAPSASNGTPRVSASTTSPARSGTTTRGVDPYGLATALQRRAIERGAVFVTDRGVETVDGNGVVLAENDARIEADVVVAAGWRTPDIVDAPLPIRSYRTQCVALEPDDPLADEFPMGRVGSEHLYFRPEHNGDLLVGGAHDLVDDPGTASEQADESFVEAVARTIPTLVDGFGDAGLVNGWAGVDSATPDARPILDRVDDVLVATGFNGLGVLAAPIAASVVESLVAGTPRDLQPFDPSPFALSRFPDRSASFDLHATSDVGR